MNNQSISERIAKVWIGHAHIDDLIAIGREVDAMSARVAELEARPVLTVWCGAMPESNGKSNYTAILHRKGSCISEGITLDRSEYPARVRYEADRVRYLIGELAEDPCICDYDADKHSGYKAPTPAQDVSALVEALEAIYDSDPQVPHPASGDEISNGRKQCIFRMRKIAADALAAYAQQKGGQHG
ncbi:hypothetical protein [Pseudomonas paeninsulae]|uniref:hypothetical protein n=1 Tax=Pseudomonas paeninsulae TaxID=3110772 RepID=UPI002D78BB60|nr:hypothetical protein [Pseudomonas sp. IT1137]